MVQAKCRWHFRCASHSAFSNRRSTTSLGRVETLCFRLCISRCSKPALLMTLVGKTRIQDTSFAPTPKVTQMRGKALRQKLLGGSLALLAGSGLVGVTNLV